MTLSSDRIEDILAADADLLGDPRYDEAAWWREHGVEQGEVDDRARDAWQVFAREGIPVPDLQTVCSFFFSSGVRFGLLIADNAKEVTEV